MIVYSQLKRPSLKISDLPKLKEGRMYKVTIRNPKTFTGYKRKQLEGKLLKQDKKKFMLQTSNYKECFLKSDILIGEISIKEI